jgi:hypothetical protein
LNFDDEATLSCSAGFSNMVKWQARLPLYHRERRAYTFREAEDEEENSQNSAFSVPCTLQEAQVKLYMNF